jgi:hypothetical protein
LATLRHRDGGSRSASGSAGSAGGRRTAGVIGRSRGDLSGAT